MSLVRQSIKSFKNSSILIRFVLCFFLLFSMYRCAHQVAPGGGPEDKTPPVILTTFPEQDSVNVKGLEYVELNFSEPILKASLANNYWIVPELSGGFEIDWQGKKRVRFKLKDSLALNQTYVFTLGTGVKDLRNNRMYSPLRLAFSTGAVIDSGSISGKVFAEKKQRDVFIYAYRLGKPVNPDSLLIHRPQYFTQANERDEFNLDHLPAGSYRVFAMRDEDLNKKYDAGVDWIGIPSLDVTLDSVNHSVTDFSLFLFQEDYSGPQIKKVDTVSAGQIDVQFTEPIQPSRDIFIQVSDSTSGENIPMPQLSFDRKTKNLVNLFFKEKLKNKRLKIQIKNAVDLAGNRGQDSVFVVTAPSHPDTTSLRTLGLTPPNGAQNVPFDAEIQASFNVPVDSGLFSHLFSMKNEKNQVVEGSFNFFDLRNPVFKPDTLLEMGLTDSIQIRVDSLKDFWGRPFPDTVLSSSFTTRKLEDLGEIAGIVTASDTADTQAILVAKTIQGNFSYKNLVKTGRKYLVEYLPQGSYLVTAILDKNGNSIWDRGKSSPWEFSEPFVFKKDTVVVRKRWTTEGVNFNFGNGE